MAAISSIIMQTVVATIIMASSATAQISSGYASYSNGNGGVCSGGGSGLPGVSMNAAQFANGAACGQCIQITGTGNGAGTSPVSTAPYVAQITNVCPQCSYGDIDLQESGDGKYGISWSFVGCPGAGRKLIETPFQGDRTVYTGFAHKGLTPTMTEEASPVAAPEQAPEYSRGAAPAASPEEAAEQTTEQTTGDAEINAEVVVTSEPSQEDSASDAISEVISKIEASGLEEQDQASQGHLQAEHLPEEAVVKTSRRLLMAN